MRSQHLKRREQDQEFKIILSHMYSEFKTSLRYRSPQKGGWEREREPWRDGKRNRRRKQCWRRSNERRQEREVRKSGEE